MADISGKTDGIDSYHQQDSYRSKQRSPLNRRFSPCIQYPAFWPTIFKLCSIATVMSEFVIRKLSIVDWKTYKAVRLNSLKDSPDSFGSTYEREISFSESDWQSRLIPKPGINISIPLIAEVDGKPVGLASGVVWESDLNVAHVYQMWVSPEARGTGIARALLDRITEWAGRRHCEALALDVTTINTAAVNLYKSAGFAPSGPLKALREGLALKIQPMARKLRDAA